MQKLKVGNISMQNNYINGQAVDEDDIYWRRKIAIHLMLSQQRR